MMLPTHTHHARLQSGKSDHPDLQSSGKVVSGGRGVGSKENVDIIFEFAGEFGATVAASYAPSDLEVGQTAKIVALGL